MAIEETVQLRQEGERRILIVDDDKVIRELCGKALRDYRILQAADGAEALSILEQESADVVLTDIMMPHVSGLDLLKAIKEREPNQVVIVMTGYADKEIILRALKADADDFISKPINLLQLKTAIDKAIEKKVLKEELVQLKRMDRLKSDFLGLISHKLKTPTTAISLFIQNLGHGIGDPDDPAFQEALLLIIEEAQYLNYLIKDLLYYSEIILQEGPLRLVPTNPGELLVGVVGELRNDLQKKQLRLDNELPTALPDMDLDRQRIDFTLRALLENAIKFTPVGGAIGLSAQLREDSVRLSISDTGPGIPPEELPKVFEKFYQVDPAHTGQVRGFGLGLFYARQFAQSHGGNILLESNPGQGTVATLILPR